MTDPNYVSLASHDLQRTLDVALELKKTYDVARDDNLNYIYWSSVPFFPLGAAAAGDIYAKRTSSLASIGIIAGTLAGFNTFTNARSNARAYQAGATALACVYTKLNIYAARDADAEQLRGDAATVTANLVPAGRAALDSAEKLDMAAKDVVAERTANAAIVPALATAERTLTQAIQDALQAAVAARTEVALFDNLSNFVTNGIIQIDTKVAGKITLTDVTFSSLVTSISAAMAVPKPPAPAGPPKAAAPAKPPGGKAKPPPATPIADAVRRMQSSITQLQQATSVLTEGVSKFGLSAREQEVDACVKSL